MHSFYLLARPWSAFLLLLSLLFLSAPPTSALRRSRNAPLFTPNVVYLYNVYGRRVRRQLSPEQFAEFSVMRSRLPCRELECGPVCTVRTINFACARCVTECAQDRVHARNMDNLRDYTWREEQEAEAEERARRARAERDAAANRERARERPAAGAGGREERSAGSGGAVNRGGHMEKDVADWE